VISWSSEQTTRTAAAGPAPTYLGQATPQASDSPRQRHAGGEPTETAGHSLLRRSQSLTPNRTRQVRPVRDRVRHKRPTQHTHRTSVILVVAPPPALARALSIDGRAYLDQSQIAHRLAGRMRSPARACVVRQVSRSELPRSLCAGCRIVAPRREGARHRPACRNPGRQLGSTVSPRSSAPAERARTECGGEPQSCGCAHRNPLLGRCRLGGLTFVRMGMGRPGF